jgi:predicted AlkP superfamily pyrophosphatase or phosphodiesterase
MIPVFRLAIFLAAALCFGSQFVAAESEVPPAGAGHVVVIVWDGMRPDFVSEKNTPRLWKLSREGVTFQHHHSVYLTATNVNGAAMATGVFPSRHGIIANREFRPAIDPLKVFENADWETVKKADEVSGGKYVAAPTVAELLRAAGRKTAIAGTKSVAFLQDRNAEWTHASIKNSIKFAAAPMPAAMREETLRLLGPFLAQPNNTSDERNRYATRALTEVMWRDELPAFSLLWLSDPDLAEHDSAPGSEACLAGVASSDRNLGIVLDALEKKKARESTDVFVVSDHGFSTVERAIDFTAELRKAGFDVKDPFTQTPKRGQIITADNAGTILFYVIEHDPDVTTKLVEWLQHSDFAGVIFAREKSEGTFPLEFVRANSADAPDVMVSLRWNEKPNQFGIPGHIMADNARPAGKGTHVTLSKFDVHNILFAAGPDFRERANTTLPSSNLDLAPTILRILGVESPNKLDGRVLVEAMEEKAERMETLSKTIDAKRKFPTGEWQQHLRVSLVGETVYIDEGNGAFEVKK